jgi:hypothetical protein
VTRSEVLIRIAAVSAVTYVLMWVFVIWLVRRSLTRNKATLIGFLLGLVAWLAYTLPEFSVATVVVGVIVIPIGMVVLRLLTPFAQAGVEIGYKMRDQRERRKR